jgi:hypothetical protein
MGSLMSLEVSAPTNGHDLRTDTNAVHRDFDCRDPDARAPTPLPPLSLEDPAEGGHKPNMSASAGTVSNRRSSSALPSSSTESIIKGLGSDKLSRSPCGYNSASDLTDATAVTILREDAESTENNPKTVSLPQSEPDRNSPSKSMTSKRDKQEPGDSPLSDCPSDLSDWAENKVRSESWRYTRVRMLTMIL